MLFKTSVILIVIALLLLLFYFLGRKKSKSLLCRISGTLSILLIITSAVLTVIHCKANNIKIFDRLKSYDITEQYNSTLAKTDEDTAYPILPYRVFTIGEKAFFTNLKNDLFSLEKPENTNSSEPLEEKAAETEYTSKTVKNGIVYADGSTSLTALIDEEGNLILDGKFVYSEYEGDKLIFTEDTVAKNVVNCSLTSNSLFYVTDNGELYGMGFNEYAQLGDTTVKAKSLPVFIAENIKFADISDTHSFIIDKFGTLYTVGDNSYSQLGNKTAVSSNILTKMMQGVKDVRVGNYFSMVLTVNGDLYTAGTNKQGQLGNSGGEFKAELVKIMSGVEKISINHNTCAALTYSGELFTWGDNTNCKAGVPEGNVIAAPKKTLDNVYDFELSDNSVVALTNERDILISDEKGKFITALDLDANVPAAFVERTTVASDELPVIA